MNDFDRAMYAWADGVKAKFNNFTNSLSNKWEEFNEWQKERSRNIKAAEREMGNAIYNWWQDVKNSINSLGQSSQTTVPKNLDNKWRKITQALNNIVDKIVNSPEVQYARDTWQFQEMARINADNHIWPARENVVYNLNTYQRTSPNWLDKWTSANSLNKAVDEYNKMLEMYWKNTSWWPKNSWWKYYRQDYMRYKDYDDKPYQFEYTVKWDKWNAILNWQHYEPQQFKFELSSWVDLLNQMRDLTNQYNKLESLEKTVWPLWNSLREQWKWDTKEAKEYLDKRSEYNEKKIETLNALRSAKDIYINLVNSYKNGTL